MKKFSARKSQQTGRMITLVVLILVSMLFLLACANESEELPKETGIGKEGGVQEKPAATKEPIDLNIQDDSWRENFEPRITFATKLPATRNVYSVTLGGTFYKGIRIDECTAFYNDGDLYNPTVLVLIRGTVISSEDSEMPVTMDYEIMDCSSFPESILDTGTIELGYYEEGESLYHVLMFKNLKPGGQYMLTLKNGSYRSSGEKYDKITVFEGSGIKFDEVTFPSEVKDLSLCFGWSHLSVSFRFFDELGKSIGCPVNADIRLESENGEMLCEETIPLTEYNFKSVFFDRDHPEEIYGKILIPIESMATNDHLLEPGMLYIRFYDEEGNTTEEMSMPYLYDNDCVAQSEGSYIWEDIRYPKAEPGVIY